MPLTRRRLFAEMFEPTHHEWLSARGHEAMTAGHVEAQMAAPGAKLIRISSNENPLGPGRHVVDAITGTFNEAARSPSTPRRRKAL